MTIMVSMAITVSVIMLIVTAIAVTVIMHVVSNSGDNGSNEMSAIKNDYWQQ